jgi:hypothetical protein
MAARIRLDVALNSARFMVDADHFDLQIEAVVLSHRLGAHASICSARWRFPAERERATFRNATVARADRSLNLPVTRPRVGRLDGATRRRQPGRRGRRERLEDTAATCANCSTHVSAPAAVERDSAAYGVAQVRLTGHVPRTRGRPTGRSLVLPAFSPGRRHGGSRWRRGHRADERETSAKMRSPLIRPFCSDRCGRRTAPPTRPT